MEFITNEAVAKQLDEIPLECESYAGFRPSREMEEILAGLAAYGRTQYDWHDVRKLIRVEMYNLLEKYFKKCGFIGPITEVFDERRDLILSLLDQYDEPPFTVQRIAELLTMEPFSQYHATHKLINAFEKLLSVAGSSSPTS